MTLIVAPAFAQQNDPVARSKAMLDAAAAQARSDAATSAANGSPRAGMSSEELRRLKTSDPETIARQYKEKGTGAERPAQELLIFVSTGMPKRALTLLATQAKETGAVLVLRGPRKPVGTPGVMTDLAEAVKPMTDAGADIQIDPEAFKRFNVTAVPTFVLTSKQQDCGDDRCAANASALAGDVSLEYALETWEARGGVAGKLAKTYLAKMKNARDSN